MPQLCPGGGLARECQSEGGNRRDLIEHMKEIWSQIGFSPTTFEIPEMEHDTDENYGGDQRVSDLSYFPRQTTKPSIPPEDMEKFCKVKINNLPKDLTDSEAITFLNNKVDKSIKAGDIEVIRKELNSQIILGPGPSNSVVTKTVEILDYHLSQKYYFQERKLYAKLMKPLSPLKPERPSDPVDNKVKSVIDNIEAIDTRKSQPAPTTFSQARIASASTTPIAKHKTVLASGIKRK